MLRIEPNSDPTQGILDEGLPYSFIVEHWNTFARAMPRLSSELQKHNSEEWALSSSSRKFLLMVNEWCKPQSGSVGAEACPPAGAIRYDNQTPYPRDSTTYYETMPGDPSLQGRGVPVTTTDTDLQRLHHFVDKEETRFMQSLMLDQTGFMGFDPMVPGGPGGMNTTRYLLPEQLIFMEFPPTDTHHAGDDRPPSLPP